MFVQTKAAFWIGAPYASSFLAGRLAMYWQHALPTFYSSRLARHRSGSTGLVDEAKHSLWNWLAGGQNRLIMAVCWLMAHF